MPTGYTSGLYEGTPTTFAEFAMRCARAFGALITLRDEPAGAAIPEAFQPIDYHAKEGDEARARLADLLAWTHEECERRAEEDYQRRVVEHERRRADDAALRARYEAMRGEVIAWQPPTPDHDGLKAFMLEQLASSIRFDCHESDPPARTGGVEFRQALIERARRDIEYHASEHAKEVARCQERTAWVQALRASLAASPREPERVARPCEEA